MEKNKTKRRLVCCVVVKWNGSILLIQRGERSPWSGQWCIPGGKIEPGENDRECAIRELFEETGIHQFRDLSNRRVIDSADESDVRFVIYDCVLNGRPPVEIEAEFQGYGWFSENALRNMRPVLMENVLLGVPGVVAPDKDSNSLREAVRVLGVAASQLAGALRLDAMVQDDGSFYGTTRVALDCYEEAVNTNPIAAAAVKGGA